jgi:hypothetical protein
MGIAEGNVYDPILRRPNSRDNGLASGRRPLPDHCLPLQINRARIRLILNFCCKIVTLVAVPVPWAGENFKTAGHFPRPGYKVLALAGQHSLFSDRVGIMISRP